jgi:hypothetical protein
MSDRRMLWKLVSQSRKVNSLSMPAALLWTWAIPFFDRDGFMEAEPDFLKVNVVPRRVDVEESAIKPLVDEIVGKDLWVSFHDTSGVRVVLDPKFNLLQKIEYKKEGRSKWEGNHLVPDDSASARRVLGDNSSQKKERKKERKKGEEPDFEAGMRHIRNIINGEKEGRDGKGF